MITCRRTEPLPGGQDYLQKERTMPKKDHTQEERTTPWENRTNPRKVGTPPGRKDHPQEGRITPRKEGPLQGSAGPPPGREDHFPKVLEKLKLFFFFPSAS